MKNHVKQWAVLLFSVATLLSIFSLFFFWTTTPPNLTRLELYTLLSDQPLDLHKPLQKQVIHLQEEEYRMDSTIKPELNEVIERLYKRYKPKYAAFVAIDPSNGAILSMVDYSRGGHEGHLALRGSFPAASIFKVVTSAAAIEGAKLSPSSRIPFNGSATSLYKQNLGYGRNRWTRFVRLDDALARSINSVFGKVAIHKIGQRKLQQYANALGFNQTLSFDVPVDISRAIIPGDSFGIAESGSGYTKRQTISPLQAALLAGTIINGGVTPNPYFIKRLTHHSGYTVYARENALLPQAISPDTAYTLAQMMEKTITKGTARRHYRDYQRHPILSKLFIGGKTGSLTGEDPKGKHDWFMGFAQSTEDPSRKIAFASLITSGKYWRVKPSYIARKFILKYFQ